MVGRRHTQENGPAQWMRTWAVLVTGPRPSLDGVLFRGDTEISDLEAAPQGSPARPGLEEPGWSPV